MCQGWLAPGTSKKSMPLYGYTCQDCHQHFEIIRPISQADEVPPACEFCGSMKTTRKLGNVIAVFGSGPQRKVIAGSGACSSCSSSGSSTCSTCSGGR
jgi:putative FmdB family regulatory protein